MAKFDLEEELNNLELPQMFIAGLRYYLAKNKIEVKSKKELEKIIKEYEKIEI